MPTKATPVIFPREATPPKRFFSPDKSAEAAYEARQRANREQLRKRLEEVGATKITAFVSGGHDEGHVDEIKLEPKSAQAVLEQLLFPEEAKIDPKARATLNGLAGMMDEGERLVRWELSEMIYDVTGGFGNGECSCSGTVTVDLTSGRVRENIDYSYDHYDEYNDE